MTILSIRRSAGRPRLAACTALAACWLLLLLGASPAEGAPGDAKGKRGGAERAGLDWWSLQPPRPASLDAGPPPRGLQGDADNLIDRIVLARLEAEGMEPAPPADRRTLLRRAGFDLLGLPPAAEELDAFERDEAPDAWDRSVDRMLASPRHGERWARHWLDVVRFAETSGYERDQLKPGIWRYRDWVIQALNEDMPYDRFVTLQLAGDEVEDRDESTLVATGMIRAGAWNDEPNDPADYVYERLEDMVHATSAAFLGLTVKCARCHDHKFDPIPQADYYRMAGFFWPGYIGQGSLGGPSAEELGADVFGWTDRGPTSEPLHLLRGGERHSPGQAVEPGFLTAVPALDRPLTPPREGARTTGRRLQLARWIVDPRNPLTARVLANRVWLHHFGAGLVRTPDNFGFKGDVPVYPELLDALARELLGPGAAADGAAVGAAVGGANGAADGAAVGAADGAAVGAAVGAADGSGPAPWSLKRLHRRILLSRTYRQSSLHPRSAELEARDPSNRLLWRHPRRRLDAEALRDALLAASGELNEAMGGPSFYPAMSAEALEGLSKKEGAWEVSPPAERVRRSIYMMTKRSRILPLMTAFDFPDTTLPCGERDVTSVAPQALALLNNAFVHERSAALARRVAREAGADPARRIAAAWRFALQRDPDAGEAALALEHLAAEARAFREREAAAASASGGAPEESPDLGPGQRALESLCHALLNTNELLYVD